jgi:hypothetical protein
VTASRSQGVATEAEEGAPERVPAETLRKQEAANRDTDQAADLYREHRTRLTDALLTLPAPGGGRLCLFGAGNCHDVDLSLLAGRFAEIHLVDLDAAALERALARQSSEVRERLVLHAPIDVAGVHFALPRWRDRPPTLGALERRRAAIRAAVAEKLPRDCDVAVSCCLATQLSLALTETLGPRHPALPDVRAHAMGNHLGVLAEALRPGGRGLLVTDVVSSDTYPLEELPADADLGALLTELLADGNYFEGADPNRHAQLLRRDPLLSRRVTPGRFLPPWRWRLAPERLCLVVALLFSRRSE